MPTYTYQCADCDRSFEQFQRFSEDPLTTCPSCSGNVRRVIHPVGVVFRGSGWYITDSRKSSSATTSPGESTTSSSDSTTTAPAAAAPEKAAAPAPVAAKAAD